MADRCPACGLALPFEAWRGESPSDETCPCCGIQLGLDDRSGGDAAARAAAYARWREAWRAGGMRWRSRGRPPPEGWDPVVQMRAAGLVEATGPPRVRRVADRYQATMPVGGAEWRSPVLPAEDLARRLADLGCGAADARDAVAAADRSAAEEEAQRAAFVARLADAFPDVARLRDEHVRDYDELLSYLLVADVAEHAIALHEEGSPDAVRALRELCAFVEAEHAVASDAVRELIEVGFLEGLAGPPHPGWRVREALGPRLRREIEATWPSDEGLLGLADDPARVLRAGDRVARVPAGIRTERDLFAALADALALPARFGHGWDALAERLGDLSWIPERRVVLLHDALPSLERDALAKYVHALATAARDAPRGGRSLVVVFPADAAPTLRALLPRPARSRRDG